MTVVFTQSKRKVLTSREYALCILKAVVSWLGSLKWYYQTGYYIESSPAIGSDGTVYVGSDDYYLYAINSDGNIIPAGDILHSSNPYNC